MPKDNVVDFKKPEPFVDDPITDVLRTGTKKLLAEALEAEIDSFLCQYRDLPYSRWIFFRNPKQNKYFCVKAYSPPPVKDFFPWISIKSENILSR